MEELRNNLFYVLNNCGLSLGEAYYVTKDVFRELEDTYKDFLTKERAAAANTAQVQSEEEQTELPQESKAED